MKKIGEIILILISVLQVPSIIRLASKSSYDNHTNLIWILSAILSIVLIILQINFSYSPKTNKFLRSVRFFLFKTKTISAILVIQLFILLLLLLINTDLINNRTVLVSLIINIISLNLLIFFEKLSNTDSKELILHDTSTGKMYLYSGNRVRHIPDPPTFDLLGFSWAEAIDIKNSELSSYQILPPITSLKDMRLFEYRGRVYGLVNDKLKHVPDPPTLNFIMSHRLINDIIKLTETDIEGYTFEKPFAHTV